MFLVLLLVAVPLCFCVFLIVFNVLVSMRVKTMLPPVGRFMDIDGNRIHYLDKGEGPAIILIHGLSGQVRYFTHSLLERLEKDYRVVIVDRPGFGHSSRKSDDVSDVVRQADIIAQLIKRLGLEKPLVVGHSLGGAVSLAMALHNPDCVGGLALIAPITHVPSAENSVVPAFRAYAVSSSFWRRVMSWTFAIPLGILRRNEVFEVLFSPDKVKSDMPTRGGSLLALRPEAYYAASTDYNLALVNLPKMEARYQSMFVPTGILFGSGDQLLNYVEQGVSMKNKNSAIDLEIIDGGHMLPVTAPDKTADFIRRMARKSDV